MDFSTQSKEISYINGLVKDGPDVLYKLSKVSKSKSDKPIEIVAELPAAINIDIILGMISRWKEIQQATKRELRVFAWSSNNSVEKYVIGCVQPVNNVYITIIPSYMKETIKNVK